MVYFSIEYGKRLRRKLSLKGTLVTAQPHFVPAATDSEAVTYHVARSAHPLLPRHSVHMGSLVVHACYKGLLAPSDPQTNQSPHYLPQSIKRFSRCRHSQRPYGSSLGTPSTSHASHPILSLIHRLQDESWNRPRDDKAAPSVPYQHRTRRLPHPFKSLCTPSLYHVLGWTAAHPPSRRKRHPVN